MIGLYLKDHLKLFSKDRRGEINLSGTDAEVLKEIESIISMDTRKEGISEEEFLDGLEEFYDKMRNVLYSYRKQKESRVEKPELKQVVVEKVEAVRVKEPVIERPVGKVETVVYDPPVIRPSELAENDKFLNAEKVSEILDCDVSYVYKLHTEQGLRYVFMSDNAKKSKKGRKFLLSEVHRYMKTLMEQAA